MAKKMESKMVPWLWLLVGGLSAMVGVLSLIWLTGVSSIQTRINYSPITVPATSTPEPDPLWLEQALCRAEADNRNAHCILDADLAEEECMETSQSNAWASCSEYHDAEIKLCDKAHAEELKRCDDPLA